MVPFFLITFANKTHQVPKRLVTIPNLLLLIKQLLISGLTSSICQILVELLVQVLTIFLILKLMHFGIILQHLTINLQLDSYRVKTIGVGYPEHLINQIKRVGFIWVDSNQFCSRKKLVIKSLSKFYYRQIRPTLGHLLFNNFHSEIRFTNKSKHTLIINQFSFILD